MSSLTDEPPIFANAWKSKIAVTYDDFELTANYTQTSPTNSKIEIITPSEIEGLTLDNSNSIVNVSFGSLLLPTDGTTQIPDSSFAVIIPEALSIASQNTSVFEKTDNGWVYSGVHGLNTFTFYLNSENVPLCLEIPDICLSVTFSEFVSA